MRDGSESFWDMVINCGFFPPYCFACGASVPQWTPQLPEPQPSNSRRLRRLKKVRELRELNSGEAGDAGA